MSIKHRCVHCGYTAPLENYKTDSLGNTVCTRCGFNSKDSHIRTPKPLPNDHGYFEWLSENNSKITSDIYSRAIDKFFKDKD